MAAGGTWAKFTFPQAKQGRHRIAIEGTASIYFNPALANGGFTYVGSAVPQGTLCYSQKVKMSGEYEGLAPGTPDGVKRMTDPPMGTLIQASTGPSGFHIEMPRGKWQKKPTVTITGFFCNGNSSVPMSTAFDVFLRIGGQKYLVGKAYGTAGIGTWSCYGPYDGPMATSCDVILRTSEKVARETLDIFEIWDGEIAYRNIPITVGR